jgi:Rha family phage regulatory protein
MTSLIPSPSISLVNVRPSVTSTQVAEHFGKNRKEVLRDIRNVIRKCPETFNERNFAPMFRTVPGPNNSERQEEYYNVFRDGFALLAFHSLNN